MKIALRTKQATTWARIAERTYRDEAHLQDLLYQAPDLIPVEDISESTPMLRVFIKEAGLPGSGATDLIGIDETGGITIVECKLATNPDVRRKVIGQVLEYAAYLWRMPYDDFDEIVFAREGDHLIDLMRQRLEGEETLEDWPAEEFRAAVASTLQSGAFRLIIAVDKLNDELRRTIQYLNGHGPAMFSIYALEVSHFPGNDLEVVVPQLHGVVAPEPPSRMRWDDRRFFQAASQENSARVIQIMRDLLDFAEAEAARVYWGTGKQTGSYTFHLLRGDDWISVFTISTSGTLMINFGWLNRKLPEPLLQELAADLRAVTGLKSLRYQANKWPSRKIERAFVTEDDVARFKDAVTKFKGKVEETIQSEA